jgi:hypothetical protein
MKFHPILFHCIFKSIELYFRSTVTFRKQKMGSVKDSDARTFALKRF